jgi:hypothetical protein
MSSPARTITLSLVSHTNAGKTTLARTLLARDVGEVRDAAHVTEFAEGHDLIATPQGDMLRVWDTPGFGDSARLLRRLRQQGNPLGWLLSTVWDRWHDRPFWASQHALRHVRQHSSVVLYLVNAAEAPAAAGYVVAEMELLAWVGKPVLVLLNQLGAPRTAAEEAAEQAAWQAHLARWPLVRQVLPLDAFARCWVHEQTLLHAVQAVLAGDESLAMARLAAAWAERSEQRFGASVQVLAHSLARVAVAREIVAPAAGLGAQLRRIGAALARRDDTPLAAAQVRLNAALDAELRTSTTELLRLHGLQGQAQGEILARVATWFNVRQRVPEGRAAVLGGALSGALGGLSADLASGGLTLGGGLLAGTLLGALGAAGVARGVNVVRGTHSSWVAWSDDAMGELLQAALLRYLAVAHFGRGRGEWVQSEAPTHWPQAVAQVLAPQQAAWAAVWQGRDGREVSPTQSGRMAAALAPLLETAARALLAQLYPVSSPSGP